MSVAVYPRLGELLHSRKLTVAELERQIEQRFGLSVDPKTLYRLTSTKPVQRADLEIAGAAAAVLGVGLGDLFEVRAIPVYNHEEADATVLDPDNCRRLAEIFDRQAREILSDAEQAELDALVADYGRRLHERRLRELAQQRGIPIEQARREAAAKLDQALAWWQTFEADPARRSTVAVRARGRRTRQAR